MEEFLKKLQLSDNAIKIYVESLGRSPLTFYELYSMVPNRSQDEFEEDLTQLINGGLLIQIVPQKQEILLHYLAIPPLLPIINYYDNINANLESIKVSISNLLKNTVNQTFQKNETIHLDTILESFQESRKDIEEDTIIQKQEIEDIVEGMEELKSLNKNVAELNQQIKIVTQRNFANLIKKISGIKSEITDEINNLEFKKHKEEIITIIDKTFKEKLDKLVQEFSIDLHELIEEKFKDTAKPIEEVVNASLQYRDDFKLILLNMVNNFETKMNKIHDFIKKNNDLLSTEMKNLETKLGENLNIVIQNSVDQVSGLSKPVEDIMKEYFNTMRSSEHIAISNIWPINSLTKINEEIQKMVTTTKEELTIIIPQLENHLAVEQFEKIPKSLKIKVAASEPHTNSSVKKFRSITNIIYKTLENENLIVLKGDDTQISIGIIREDATSSLDDFIGIGSNFKPLIELLNPIILNLWEDAYSDSFYASQKAQTPTSKSQVESKTYKGVKPITTTKSPYEKTVRKSPIAQKTQESKKASSLPDNQPQIDEIKKKLQEKLAFVSSSTRKKGDEAGRLINSAFDGLSKKLYNIKGDDFSNELQKIADLILEKRGFSVTLHKLRSLINQYRFSDILLNESDSKQIMDNIENWKEKLG
ncbi:MAG: hypothetical protein KGD58_03280 [Candidatus Lokiarchaeota archaeon]|nr:hypothetical protein [Candidatus Lokiarchaeota archaeon]